MQGPRHLVNFALLLSFCALVVSGVLSFTLPFSLVTTRVHVIFGLVSVLLIAFHLVERAPYFRSQIKIVRRERRSLVGRLAAVLACAAILCLAIYDKQPVSAIIAQTYEARHRNEIVRSSPLVGLLQTDFDQVVNRKPGKDADLQISLLVRLAERASSTKSKADSASLAIWAETTSGTMIETLYVDPALAYSDQPVWNGVSTPRSSILPIWRHRYTAVSGVEPSGELDAATGATASHSFSLTDYLQIGQSQRFVVCVELNAPADSNSHFPDRHLGQPSLLYTALVDVDGPENYFLLSLTGHGGGAETSGAIQYDMDFITSAKELLELVLIQVSREF